LLWVASFCSKRVLQHPRTEPFDVQVYGAAKLDQRFDLLLVILCLMILLRVLPSGENLLAQAADFIFHSMGHGTLDLETSAPLVYMSRSICGLQRFV
jgi:hypothetical protein